MMKSKCAIAVALTLASAGAMAAEGCRVNVNALGCEYVVSPAPALASAVIDQPRDTYTAAVGQPLLSGHLLPAEPWRELHTREDFQLGKQAFAAGNAFDVAGVISMEDEDYFVLANSGVSRVGLSGGRGSAPCLLVARTTLRPHEKTCSLKRSSLDGRPAVSLQWGTKAVTGPAGPLFERPDSPRPGARPPERFSLAYRGLQGDRCQFVLRQGAAGYAVEVPTTGGAIDIGLQLHALRCTPTDVSLSVSPTVAQ